MERYHVNQFDLETFIVIDNVDEREVCICADINDIEDAKSKAEKIAAALNFVTAEPEDAYDASLKCMEIFFRGDE